MAPTEPTPAASAAVVAATPASEGIPVNFVALAKSLDPSVVTIRTSAVVRGARRLPPWLGEGEVQSQEEIALGSGVIVDNRGLIVTNQHVVAGGTDIRVGLKNGVEVPARIIGHDEDLDVALLRVDAPDLVAAPLGDSDDLAAGQWIVAIGNPFGLDHTVTAGIVSAVDRSVQGEETLNHLLQTDAAINSGNSGGPLVNLAGQVIGIDVAIATTGDSSGNIGVGFAIPIDSAMTTIDKTLS